MSTPFVIPALLFVLTLAAGVWLSRSGKPLKTAIFTVHKLIALGAVVAAAFQTYGALKNTESQGLLIALIVLVALCVVALFATGALMSAERPGYKSLLIIHKIAPFLAVITGVAAISLLIGSA